MSKSAVMKKRSKERMPEFNFSDFIRDPNDPDDEMILGMISGIIEANRHQQQTAIELTKLILSKNASDNMTEEEIVLTFKRAWQTVSELSPIQELFDKLRD